ncbi:tyrosine-type recombinase/integrase [Streptosporangium subroseum]|uniref:tyrosine-type recombinase/integrase n=1 Tax=Streptosporangium subroseum TaxID=106412 RepID=UPI00343DEB04
MTTVGLDADTFLLAFTNRIRKIPQRSSFGGCWREVVEKAGLPKRARFHDLRHYCASTLIAANLNPKSIQRRLGHATISETFDAYGHLFPDDEDLGRGAIDAKIEKDLAEQSRNKKEA